MVEDDQGVCINNITVAVSMTDSSSNNVSQDQQLIFLSDTIFECDPINRKSKNELMLPVTYINVVEISFQQVLPAPTALGRSRRQGHLFVA
jgi:hypothetical protein